MSPRQQFQPGQAVDLARAFDSAGVDYLFIDKSAAILLGFPAMTQDVHVFPAKTRANGERIVAALRQLGFPIEPGLEQAILGGRDFVQIKEGPFDVDLVFAPDGIASFDDAKSRSLLVDGFRVANLRDVIASKRASGRAKDLLDMPLLERFREEYEKQNPQPLRAAADIAADRRQSGGNAPPNPNNR